MADVRKGDLIVVGRQGLRVFPAETMARQSLFEFMASPVSSEKPKGVTVREIAAAMKRTKAAGERIRAVRLHRVDHHGAGAAAGRTVGPSRIETTRLIRLTVSGVKRRSQTGSSW